MSFRHRAATHSSVPDGSVRAPGRSQYDKSIMYDGTKVQDEATVTMPTFLAQASLVLQERLGGGRSRT